MTRLSPKYSVVVLTYNRAKMLPLCLGALSEQTVSPDLYEILVIDDSSTDNTAEVMQKFIASHPSHHIFHHRVPHGGEAKGRNEGIKRSLGEYVFFTDDDCIAPPNWIEHFSKTYERYPEAVGVSGWHITPPAMLSSNPIMQYIDFMFFKYGCRETTDILSSDFWYNTGAGNTANASYKKRILEELGGFDETQNFSGSVDFELKRRIMDRGWKLCYTPLLAYHLKETKSLRDLWKLGVIRGRGARFLAEKYADLRMTRYGYSGRRLIKWETEFIIKEASPRFAFYNLVYHFGRRRGWNYGKKNGPHPEGWDTSSGMWFTA